MVKPDRTCVLSKAAGGRKVVELIKNKHPGILNLCGKTSLNQLVETLTRSNLLVSNDSGAMHVMAALQRPQIGFFGSGTPRWTATLNPRAEVF